MLKRKSFDKYYHYLQAVQSPEYTIPFLDRVYRSAFGQRPETLGEDFCGTFAISCLWVSSGSNRSAVAVDYDPEPLAYGREHYRSRLRPDARRRLRILRSDVRNHRLPQVDVLAALNFSYFIFRDRAGLGEYLRTCRRRLGPKGMLVLDCFGGSETMGPVTDRHRRGGFLYYWDQVSFDPITNEAKFYIHFKRPGERKRERVFTYEWRMWTLPELRELLHEVGFAHVDVYWEGTDKKGEGNGVYRKRIKGDPDAAWLAYLTAY